MRSVRFRSRLARAAVAILLTQLAIVSANVHAPALVAAQPTAPRVAFTDDQDRITAVTPQGVVQQPVFAGGPTAHEGEVSGNDFGPVEMAFVSTRDNPSGDVYVVPPSSEDSNEVAVRVTCDGATKTHPVLSPNGTMVAYASNASGHYRIQIATLPEFSVSSPPTSVCDQVTRRTLSDPNANADDLWPSWLDGGDGLVFSSTRDNPLGDVYEQDLTGAATRLTDGTRPDGALVANTQPAVDGGDVLFTTTQFRPDGSIGTVPLPSTGAAIFALTAPVSTVSSAWDTDNPPQSSEVVAVPSCDPKCFLFTSTKSDPYGDVFGADHAFESSALRMGSGSISPIGAVAGVAESHPAVDVSTGDVLFTSRSITADVSDVIASDGSDRRTVAHVADQDSSAPAYSPDATQIAFSQTTAGGGRAIVIADADGSNPTVQDFGRGAFDDDLEPAWSPDGTKIAFVRTTRSATGVTALPQVYIADVGAATATHLDESDADRFYDGHPSWSPAGTRLVFSRVPAPVDLVTTISATPATIDTANGSTTLIASVHNFGIGTAEGVALDISIPSGLSVDRGSLPGACSQTAVGVTCSIDTMASNQGAVFEITLNNTFPCGSHTVTLTGDANTTSIDTNPANNQATTTVSVQLIGCIGFAELPQLAAAAPPPAAPLAVPTPGLAISDALRGEPLPASGAQPQLWIADAPTGAVAPLTDTLDRTVLGRTPAWSPDGLHIAYEAGGQLDVATLASTVGVADIPETATDLNQLTGFATWSSAGGGVPTPTRGRLATAHDPAWTPDGARIAFAGEPAGQPDQSGIYVLNATDGTGLRTIAQEPGPETEPTVQPYADLGVTIAAVPATILIGHTTNVTAMVTNAGPSRAAGTTLLITLPSGIQVSTAPAPCVLAPPTISCPLGVLGTGASQAVSFTATGTVVGNHTLTATVGADTPDPAPANNTASTPVTVTKAPPGGTPPGGPPPGTVTKADVAVAVHLSAPVGYVGGALIETITVTNHGPSPAVGVTLQTSHSASLKFTGASANCLLTGLPCALGTMAVGGHATFLAHLTPEPVGTPPHGYAADVHANASSLVADPVPANNAAQATLSVKQPTVQLLPPIGPPGFVTLAFGQNMPPGSQVTLVWDHGITTDSSAHRVAADGTVLVPVLVVRRDSDLGRRQIVATSTTALFLPVTGPMLVVPGSQEPPRFLERD